MTVSKWLIGFLRDCPVLPSFLFYNSMGEASDGLAIVENVGESAINRFVDGSYMSELPFMLLMRCTQDEAVELERQDVYSKLCDWIEAQPIKGARVDDTTAIMTLKPTSSNLVPVERDKNGNITYQALFKLKYFKGVKK